MANNYSTYGGLFDGRATRSEFWRMVTIQLGIGLVFLLIGSFMTDKPIDPLGESFVSFFICGSIVFGIGLPIMVRRCQDLNVSGWWLLGFILLLLIPYVNAIVVIVNFILLGFIPGTRGRNSYGPDPLLPESNPQAQTDVSSVDIKTRLEDLKTLLDTGEISHEEYSAQRERILKEL